MQLMRRRVGDRITLSLVARTLSDNVKLNNSGPSPIQTYENAEVDKLLPRCSRKYSEIGCSSGEVLESLQRQLAGWGRIQEARSRHVVVVSIVKCCNPVVHLFDWDHAALCRSCLGKDEVSRPRPTRAVTNEFVTTGRIGFITDVLGKLVWKACSRGLNSSSGVDWRGSVSCLHTEGKGDEFGHEKSEDVRSLVEEEASTRGRSVGSTAYRSISRKNATDFRFPSYKSARDDERDYLPVRKTASEFAPDEEGAQKLLPVAENVSTDLNNDDHEQTQKISSQARGQVVQQHLPSNSTYSVQSLAVREENRETRKYASAQAMALLRVALDEADGEDGKVKEEFQRSLRVGIVGAPNAGKSLLTNQLVGTRVSAVSQKTNTTHREHFGVFTKGDTQLLYYDTPGLHLDVEGSPLRVDTQHRVQSAWEIVNFCEALVVLVDAERQIRRPDKRVQRLVENLGKEHVVSQKRVLCLNKVDLIEQKRLLLPLAKEFEDLLGYDRIFMISGVTGSGVNDVKDYLRSQAVLRPWDEDPELTNHRDIALEIVREQVFEHLHEELPHTTKQKLVSWKVLKDGSVRIQQLLLVAKKEHQKILVGKNGAVIGDIGIKARKELQQILGVPVHLVLDVKRMAGLMTSHE